MAWNRSSKNPTLDEIAAKAKALTGTDPVTGLQTYGYYYQGKYAVWQFLTIAHALGANWGEVDATGKMTVNWNTPEYLKALEWFVEMSKFAPSGDLAVTACRRAFSAMTTWWQSSRKASRATSSSR